MTSPVGDHFQPVLSGVSLVRSFLLHLPGSACNHDVTATTAPARFRLSIEVGRSVAASTTHAKLYIIITQGGFYTLLLHKVVCGRQQGHIM